MSEKIKPPTNKFVQLITPQQIENYRNDLTALGFDLQGVGIHAVAPGDDLFDWQEITYKYRRKKGRVADLEVALEMYDEDQTPENMEVLRAVALVHGIVPSGNLPGFAHTTGKGQILFLAAPRKNLLAMARKYAGKEREVVDLHTSKEALSYLKKLAETAFYHEVGHAINGRLPEEKNYVWRKFVLSRPEIIDHVIELQKDKYRLRAEIPVFSEAFAEFFVDFASGQRLVGRLTKRLDRDAASNDTAREALAKITEILKNTS